MTPLDQLSAWEADTGSLQVAIEAPRGSHNKYKYDPKSGQMRLDKVLPPGMSFPLDFGFVPPPRAWRNSTRSITPPGTRAREVFNDTQRARYQQYNYQYGGFGTLYDPDVQKQLNLTAEQQKNLRAQWDWSNQELADINRTGATDATKGTQMYRDYWTARQERLNKFLTPEQQKAWGTMVGDPYTFQPTFTPQR